MEKSRKRHRKNVTTNKTIFIYLKDNKKIKTLFKIFQKIYVQIKKSWI
jgi:hypothetical protein